LLIIHPVGSCATRSPTRGIRLGCQPHEPSGSRVVPR
jgi:hypothetical protein